MPDTQATTRPELSIIVPCFNEEETLRWFFEKMQAWITATHREQTTEVVLVDDGSQDSSWRIIEELTEEAPWLRAVKMIENRGSHAALRCGYAYARGEFAINLPVDLQEPLDNITLMLEEQRRSNAAIVLAVRQSREDHWLDAMFSRWYHGLLRRIGLKNLPQGGAAQFLFSRHILGQINSYPDQLLTIDGFIANSREKTSSIYYHRVAAGRVSRWSLNRKVTHALNTIVLFSEIPIRAIGLFGLLSGLSGFLVAAFVFVRALRSSELPEGWASLMCVVLILGGVTLISLSIIGEYLWRILAEARRRPVYFVEQVIKGEDQKRS